MWVGQPITGDYQWPGVNMSQVLVVPPTGQTYMDLYLSAEYDTGTYSPGDWEIHGHGGTSSNASGRASFTVVELPVGTSFVSGNSFA